MNSSGTQGKLAEMLAVVALAIAAATVTAGAQTTRSAPSRNLLLWDTLAPVGDRRSAEERSGWKAVPDDLMRLEADPAKASSDPGYYGRDYSFKGDTVVETPTLAAVFSAARGCVTFYSKQASSGEASGSAVAGSIGDQVVEVAPARPEGATTSITHIEVVRNVDDEIVLRVYFSPPGSGEIAGVFSFDKTGVVEVKPGVNMRRVQLSSSIEYGVVPGFVGDDLILGGPEQPDLELVNLPSENLFLGLLEGERTELVMTWPKGKQRVSLRFGEDHGKRLIKSLDFDDDAQSFYLAGLTAPGIWHKETLAPAYLEKDVSIQWKRPFPARWKTQLSEDNIKTTFAFRETKGEIWRGVAGSYTYPVWFSGEDAFYHLGKKVQPKGESIIYCLEGRDTPLTVSTPVDILKQTLGRQASEPILDFAGRKLRTHHRRGADGVRRACTCGCTEAIQAVFEEGKEVGQQEYIREALDDMIYFVHCHVERINEYRRFADDLLKTIQQEKRSSPSLKPLLDSLEEIAQQIPQECEVQKENMKTLEHAEDLARKTMALTAKHDPGNVKAYMELLKAWRDMGGAQDYVVAKCHRITRSIFQAAGYGCGGLPGAVSLAEGIRARCRQTLRNPDGYEIWADY